MLAATRKVKVVTDDSETNAAPATDALQAAMALQETGAVMATYVQQANQQYAFDHDWRVAITEAQLQVRHVSQATAMLNMAALFDQSDITTVANKPSVTQQEREMLTEIRTLSVEKQKELREWLDAALAAAQNERLINAMSALSEESFARLWDNPVDASYDDV